jgi:peroxiredoxin
MESAPVPSVGDKVADFTLPDSAGAAWQLSSHTSSGFCLVIFYRGHW